ncbi:MAG: hydrogenase 4 subunit F [Candidatus Wallbacteria bacterium]|nr:hydrogenase 4 subunit F [Candidatus Wallbacteria bacterium]
MLDLLLTLGVAPVAWALLMLMLAPTRDADRFGAGGALAALVGSCVLFNRVYSGGAVLGWGGNLRADLLSAGTLLLTSTIFCLASVYAGAYLEAEAAKGHLPAGWRLFYWPLTFLFYAAMVWTCTADNLGILWVSLELTTLVTLPLICLARERRGLEAAWKYFVLCSVGIAFALIGTIALYASSLRIQSGGTGSLNWSYLLAHAAQLDPLFVRLAFVFTVVGYGCKMGLVPMHCWLPDAHSEAPTPVSALLSGVLLNCAAYALLRVSAVAARSMGPDRVEPTLLAFGLASVVMASFFIVVQTDLKRLLAYSSIEHMGIVAIGLGLGTAGLYGALLHAINHAVAKALLFLAAGQTVHWSGTKQIPRIQGVLRTGRPTGLALGAASLAIVGLPPFSLFLSEFLVIRAAFLSGHVLAGVALVGALGLTFAGFMSHLIPVLCGERPRGLGELRETRGATTAFVVLGILCLSLGLRVPLVLDRVLHTCIAALAWS